jgi:alpha-glucosidase
VDSYGQELDRPDLRAARLAAEFGGLFGQHAQPLHRYLARPMFHRTGGIRRGRDGCRVPLPWRAEHDSFGFSPAGGSGTTWLPQPDLFADHAVDHLLGSSESMLHLYREARLPTLGSGELRWLPTEPGVFAFTRGSGFACAINCSPRRVCNRSTPPSSWPAMATLGSDLLPTAPPGYCWPAPSDA